MTSSNDRFTSHPGFAPERPRIKRFYTVASVEARPEGYAIVLDGRSIRTPARGEMVLPVQSLGEAVAAEWQAQGEFVEPASMPLTRLVNSAIDGVAGREPEVRADIVSYAGSDLLCYGAERPEDLALRQARQWGAIHDWAEQTHGIRLAQAAGVMPVEQDAAMLARIAGLLEPFDALALAGLHTITTLTGSALLALAVANGRLMAAEAWALAHIDEDFQIERWGADSEAAERRAGRWTEMSAAALLIAATTA